MVTHFTMKHGKSHGIFNADVDKASHIDSVQKKPKQIPRTPPKEKWLAMKGNKIKSRQNVVRGARPLPALTSNPSPKSPHAHA